MTNNDYNVKSLSETLDLTENEVIGYIKDKSIDSIIEEYKKDLEYQIMLEEEYYM